jgi:hypothetical protein
MRSVTRTIAPVLAVALAACGNYSTEDLRFLAALPTRADLQVAVPADGNPGAATACGPMGSANVWLWAKPTSDGLNAAVGFVVSLIDVVRKYPPTDREKDLRRWGPFPDEKHPGKEIQIIIQRTYPAGEDGPPVHLYAFQARETGVGAFRDVISGSFEGASASRGRGTVVLSFQTMWDLATNESTTPHGTMEIAYDRASDPVTIDLQLTDDGFDVVQFHYGFAGYRDGHGAFDYAFRNVARDLLEVKTRYDAAGAGRNAVAFTKAGGGTGSFQQCWDGGACLTYVDDPAGFTCGPAPCEQGSESACVTGPIPPF